MTLDADVAIVGAGPAGLAAALSLKQLSPDTRVMVFDSARNVHRESPDVNAARGTAHLARHDRHTTGRLGDNPPEVRGFAGTYVLHCHILAHEDRGMMQLVRVMPPNAPIGACALDHVAHH